MFVEAIIVDREREKMLISIFVKVDWTIKQMDKCDLLPSRRQKHVIFLLIIFCLYAYVE